MKATQPFIGITCEVHVPKENPKGYELVCDHRYSEAIKDAGGFPILLPIAWRQQVIEKCLNVIDGLIIVGGDDVDPRLYGETPKDGTGSVFPARLRFEKELYALARRRRIPILGICYGMQLINVLESGTLYQDIRRDAKSDADHRNGNHYLRKLRVDSSSRLARILGKTPHRIHCDHHQAVSRVAPGFRPVAFAPDGIVEAIEGEHEEILAVQWHPERTLQSDASKRLFRYFVNLCRD